MRKKTTFPYSINLALSTIILLLVSVMGFSACSELNLDGTEGEGTINFYMSNSSVDGHDLQQTAEAFNLDESELQRPANLQEVNIDVQELRVRFSTVRIDTVNADSIVTERGDTEWMTIEFEPVILNLLDLEDVNVLFAEADLPEGFYSEIRLVLGQDNSVVDEDGNEHSLMVPSGQQSGYKIKFDARLSSGETIDLTINFDAEKSVHVTGNNRYMLKPVLNTRRGLNNNQD